MPYDSGKSKAEEKQPAEQVREGLYTYDDYAALDDGNRYELAGGKLELMSPGTSVGHQFVSFELQKKLDSSCGDDFVILCAPLDVILSQYEVRQPDLVMIRRDRLSIVKRRGIEGPPDLVVEILSPSTVRRDKLDKLLSYAKYAIPEYWMVDPVNEALEQFVLQGEAYRLHDLYTGDVCVASANIPCASFSMNDIMSRIPKLRD